MIKYATICYLTVGGKTLMINKNVRLKDPNSGMYTAPGGKVKPGEKIIDSVKREFKEETGYNLINPRFVGTILFDNKNRGDFINANEFPDFLVYCFRATKFSGNSVTSTHEGFVEWVDNGSVTEVNKREGDKKMWNLINSGRKFQAVFKYVGEDFDEENSRIVLF